MVINWYGEGCFRLQTGGTTVLIDPYDKSTGLTPPRFKSDILVKTKTDYPLDYKDTDSSSIFSAGEYEIKGIEVLGWYIPGDANSLKSVYLIKAEGLNLGILGHLTENLEADVVDKLSASDILFAPVGGVPYIKIDNLIKLIKTINPLIVVASFFKISGLKTKSGDIKDFLKEFGQAPGAQDSLVVKKKDLPNNT